MPVGKEGAAFISQPPAPRLPGARQGAAPVRGLNPVHGSPGAAAREFRARPDAERVVLASASLLRRRYPQALRLSEDSARRRLEPSSGTNDPARPRGPG